jgi:hypothetical protein
MKEVNEMASLSAYLSNFIFNDTVIRPSLIFNYLQITVLNVNNSTSGME